MKYITPPLIGLLLALVSAIAAPIGMLFAIWFVKWDSEPTTDSYGTYPTIRGDLPNWLAWFSTPDERCPGPTYEPTIREMLEKEGKLWTTYHNLGFRNQMMGLAAWLGKPATYYIPEQPDGYYEFEGVWRYSKTLGSIKFVCGWQVSRKLDKTFLAVPVFTIKRL